MIDVVELSKQADANGVPGVVRYLAGELIIPDTGFMLLSDLYDAGVRGADFTLGRILEHWIGHDAEGIVAVTSDHGEAFGEHGLLDHRGSVYPELLHVPLAIAAPGRLPAGVRVEEPVSLIELSSTLLRLAGLDAPSPGLIPILRGVRSNEPITAMAWPVELWARHAGGRFEDRWWLYREGSWALVSNGQDENELYDLARDPRMTRNLAGEEPERLAELASRAHAAIGKIEEAATTATVDLPPETRARLRQLGYGD